ncbi:unnamed protein product, partial [Dicrocoelium dendriticum]
SFSGLWKDMRHTPTYLDDILVSGRIDAEHLNALRTIFERLETNGMKLKKSK